MTLGDLKYIKTGPGICLSWTFLILTAFYAFALLDKLVERLDPVESVVFDENHYTHLDLVDMAGEGSKIAFGVMN
jgi:hypothetical protein